MIQRMKKILLLTGAALCLLGSVCFAVDLDDRDLEFVDARDGTGYYVDVYSLNFTSDHEVTAAVAMVKARTNRMFLYTIHFDTAAATYQILDSEVMRYDTKELIGGSSQPLPASGYGISSPMRAIVDYIYSLPRDS